ncbi:hypothetical protein OEZ85_013338 [Tetradesmus obliquus]|uniref:Uncharacterized protein n=1 Tax=Tetradesmus obliquus TaxID=3088 RepID=A0ABY8U5F0_TETOB|nr:hypothetical protein OEZ85_013338 [Tetradesmus obliquus]
MQAPSAAAEPDGEGRQFLDVQRHAAAVQLLGRSLAVAHLRAQAAMPKGSSLHMPAKPAATIKQEDGAALPLRQQQQRGQAAAAQHANTPQQVIKAAQQLAGWVRLAGPGEAGEGEGMAGQGGGGAAFEDDDGLLGAGGAELAEDMLDEEEWV